MKNISREEMITWFKSMKPVKLKIEKIQYNSRFSIYQNGNVEDKNQ